MKIAFIHTLTDLMRKHDDIVVLTADMGYSVFEGLQKEFPKRFFNTGVTEQSTMGMAAGLALSGYTVFVYAQAIFLTMRCLEQVRLDVAYNHANVKLIGTAGGFWLNQLGESHFALEDIGAMRLLPGMTILTPGDPYEAAWATRKAYDTRGPVYMRLAKPDRQFIHKKPVTAAIGNLIQIARGQQGVLLVSGTLLSAAGQVRQKLLEDGISIAIYSVPTIKPMNRKSLGRIMKQYPYVFTLEEHSVIGGLGAAVSDYITDNGLHKVTLTRFGVPDAFIHVTGSREYLLERSGLSPVKLAKRTRSVMKKRI